MQTKREVFEWVKCVFLELCIRICRSQNSIQSESNCTENVTIPTNTLFLSYAQRYTHVIGHLVFLCSVFHLIIKVSSPRVFLFDSEIHFRSTNVVHDEDLIWISQPMQHNLLNEMPIDHVRFQFACQQKLDNQLITARI